jgi:hypothetical protein
MNCVEFRLGMNLLFDNLADETLKTDIESHLRICNTCSQEYNRLKHYFEKLQNNSSGIDVSGKFIQETIDYILDKPNVPVEVPKKESPVSRIPVESPKISIETITSKKPDLIKKDIPRESQKAGNMHLDLYFFYTIIALSLLVIGYITIQFFIN